MSLLDALASEPKRSTGRTCSFGAWIATLTPDEAAAVREAVAAPARKRSDRELAALLADNGYLVSHSTIGVHRRNECVSCRF